MRKYAHFHERKLFLLTPGFLECNFICEATQNLGTFFFGGTLLSLSRDTTKTWLFTSF